jgi:hypothetical protein
MAPYTVRLKLFYDPIRLNGNVRPFEKSQGTETRSCFIITLYVHFVCSYTVVQVGSNVQAMYCQTTWGHEWCVSKVW